MDFFEQQDKARRKTKWLVVYFALAILSITAVVYCVALPIYGYTQVRRSLYQEQQLELRWWNPKLFLGVAAANLGVIFCGSLYKIQELAQGGSALAESLGGELVNPNTTDPDERRLLNVVEEMAIASGVPVPQVYVLYDEKGINAFAAGHTTSDCIIGVTRGSLKLLTRDELQGVIGHEFSHILNGDMRLNLRLMGMIFGILCLAAFGRILLSVRGGSSSRNNAAPALIGLVLLVVGSIGVFFGRLIQAAVSRQREFLADASSVQFTRNPAGLSGALQKIGGYSFQSFVISENAPDAAHMFFGAAMPRPFFNPMATHPPLEQRIRAVDPAWNGVFPKVSMEPVQHEDVNHPTRPRPVFMDGKLIAVLGAAGAAGAAGLPATPPMIHRMGAPTPTHLHYADEVRNALPPALKIAARDPMGAAALVYALLMVENETGEASQPGGSASPERSRRLQLLQQSTSPAMRQETERLLPDVDNIAHHAKLPLVDLALPALRHFSPAQYAQFNTAIQALIQGDGKLDLFEYVLQKIVLRHLDSHFNAARKPIVQYYALKPLAEECSIVLSALARLACDDPAGCESAFQQGAQALAYAQLPLACVPAAQCELPHLDAALDKLNQAVPQIKRNVLHACAQVVATDGLIRESEAELLRAIADTLDCPLPPFLAEVLDPQASLPSGEGTAATT